MNNRTKFLSIAAALGASALALQMPMATAADYSASSGTNTTAQASDTNNGVPGVDLDVGKNASDRGLPGVELNAGRDGDQQNIGNDTRTLGAGPDMGTQDDSQTTRPMRADRN